MMIDAEKKKEAFELYLVAADVAEEFGDFELSLMLKKRSERLRTGKGGVFKARNEKQKRAIYWPDGEYVVQLESVKVHEGRNTREYFIVSGETIKSNTENCKAGTVGNWVIDLSRGSGYSNVRQFFIEGFGIAEEDLEQVVDQAISDENPFRGFFLNLQVSSVSAKGGQSFSKHVWSLIEEVVS